MQRATMQPASNPLASLASALPVPALIATDVAARAVGGFLSLVYAWSQYNDFDQFFGRTWALAIVVAAVAQLSLVPRIDSRAIFIRAAGTAVLFFGGAMLASEWTGMVMVLCGAIAWLATASIAHQRGVGPGAAVGGMIVGTAALFAVVGVIFLTIEG
jgi:hypothetical protein